MNQVLATNNAKIFLKNKIRINISPTSTKIINIYMFTGKNQKSLKIIKKAFES